MRYKTKCIKTIIKKTKKKNTDLVKGGRMHPHEAVPPVHRLHDIRIGWFEKCSFVIFGLCLSVC